MKTVPVTNSKRQRNDPSREEMRRHADEVYEQTQRIRESARVTAHQFPVIPLPLEYVHVSKDTRWP